MKILTFNGQYIPGFKAGGPIRSIANMSAHLKKNIDFYVVTTDKDSGDDKPYENITSNSWNRLENEFVYYQKKSEFSFWSFKKIIQKFDSDIVLLNGVFSSYTIFYLIFRKFRLINKSKVVIMARGDLASGALSLKSNKKNIYLNTAKLLGFYNRLYWISTSKEENDDIIKIFGKSKMLGITTLPNMPTKNHIGIKQKTIKSSGILRLIYISRVAEVKNLHYALKILEEVDCEVHYDIYGPIYDDKYWEQCKIIIDRLKNNIKVTYKGSLDNNLVFDTLQNYHALFLPTMGENYGHVIVESMLSGTPVIISDKTPWHNLEENNAGWDIPLTNKEKYLETVNNLSKCTDEDLNILSKNAYEYINKQLDVEKIVAKYKYFFYKI